LALWKISPNDPHVESAISLTIGLCSDKDAEVRFTAACALSAIGPSAKSAVPVLTKMLEDKNEWVRKAAADALEKIKNGKKQEGLQQPPPPPSR
jgi:HEAT repeat protein